MKSGNVARVMVVLVACVATVGSASSGSNTTATDPQYGATANSPPPAQPMEPGRALGLWRSTFGAVKIEADNSKGGLQTGAVQGVWVYQRKGQEVVGYFAGTLRGNVMQFTWQEPSNPPLTGAGYLVFDPQGRQYSGRWWSDRRDRVGDWNGWRQTAAQNAQYANQYGGGAYGGQAYGAQPPRYPQPPQYPQQYPQQPQQPQYPQQPQQYPPQQYPQQQYPQQPPQQYPQQPQQYPQQPQQYPQQYPQQPQQPGYPQGYPQQPR
jgi:hypothetical protein